MAENPKQLDISFYKLGSEKHNGASAYFDSYLYSVTTPASLSILAIHSIAIQAFSCLILSYFLMPMPGIQPPVDSFVLGGNGEDDLAAQNDELDWPEESAVAESS